MSTIRAVLAAAVVAAFLAAPGAHAKPVETTAPGYLEPTHHGKHK